MPPTSVDHLTTTMTNYKQLCAELIDDLELCDWPYKLKETIRADIDRVRAALAEPEQEIYYEFSVLNDEYCTEAGGTAPTLQQALDEGRRYFAEYSQDGNYTLEVRRVEVIPIDRARAALAESEPEVPTDAELLQVFDTACLSEGGMVDEIHLRGLRAVLARWGNHPGSPDSSMQPQQSDQLMTKQLSPAAQAVFDSYKAASDGCYSGGEWLQNEAGQIAAALRAAVNEVAPEKTIEDISYVHQSYVDGYKDALYEILIIANEIELEV